MEMENEQGRMGNGKNIVGCGWEAGYHPVR